MIDFLLGVPGKLATIYTHLTSYLSSTRCAKIDNLDAAITTRAAAATALSTATWTNTKAGYLDASIAGRLGAIKAIYRGTITISSGTTKTATITAVDTAKTVLINLGASNSTQDSSSSVRLELTNSTTITATRNTSSTSTYVVGYQVIEFN